MAQLVIPDIDEAVLQRLRERARSRGTTAEAEAGVVLAEALQRRSDEPLESAEHRSFHQPLDISASLEELKSLKDGWLDGSGLAPRSEGLDWLTTAWRRFYAAELQPPHLYPTADGGIRAEWSLGSNEASLEVGLPGHSAQWHSLNLDTDETELHQLSLDRQSDWVWLADRIRGLSKAVQ